MYRDRARSRGRRAKRERPRRSHRQDRHRGGPPDRAGWGASASFPDRSGCSSSTAGFLLKKVPDGVSMAWKRAKPGRWPQILGVCPDGRQRLECGSASCRSPLRQPQLARAGGGWRKAAAGAAAKESASWRSRTPDQRLECGSASCRSPLRQPQLARAGGGRRKAAAGAAAKESASWRSRTPDQRLECGSASCRSPLRQPQLARAGGGRRKAAAGAAAKESASWRSRTPDYISPLYRTTSPSPSSRIPASTFFKSPTTIQITSSGWTMRLAAALSWSAVRARTLLAYLA